MDGEILKVLEHMFLKDANISLHNLFVFNEEEDYNKLSLIVHKLLGQSRLIDLEPFALSCEEVEKCLKTENKNLIFVKLILLKSELEVFKTNRIT